MSLPTDFEEVQPDNPSMYMRLLRVGATFIHPLSEHTRRSRTVEELRANALQEIPPDEHACMKAWLDQTPSAVYELYLYVRYAAYKWLDEQTLNIFEHKTSGKNIDAFMMMTWEEVVTDWLAEYNERAKQEVIC